MVADPAAATQPLHPTPRVLALISHRMRASRAPEREERVSGGWYRHTYSEMSGGANHSRPTSMVYPDGFTVDDNYASGLDSTISRLRRKELCQLNGT